MKCYCYETDAHFVFCVEDFEVSIEENLKQAWFEKSDQKYLKKYNKDMEVNGVTPKHKQILSENFARLGPVMFAGVFNWEAVVSVIAEQFNASGIEWYLIGSASDAARGIQVKPHDIDIIVNTKDFFKVRDLCAKSVVEPFVDNLGTWTVRYFGRLCIEGAMVDIAADEKSNLEKHPYERIVWNHQEIYVEPFKSRYQTEIQRNRSERIRAFESFVEKDLK